MVASTLHVRFRQAALSSSSWAHGRAEPKLRDAIQYAIILNAGCRERLAGVCAAADRLFASVNDIDATGKLVMAAQILSSIFAGRFEI